MFSKPISIKALQEYIRQKDHKPELLDRYFMKLSEEVGELSRAIRKDLRYKETGTIKETIEEELYDTLYYVLALANIYDIDMEEAIQLKEHYNQTRKDH